ncbi:hypothetical protein V6Z11_D10G074800 [Gossypium hirsutum]|nr:hypothetical protein GOBAR_DD10850 [Gossypium barbadense]
MPTFHVIIHSNHFRSSYIYVVIVQFLAFLNWEFFATDAGLRERLNKIMALDYFTTTPEIEDPAAGTYTSFQVLVHAVPIFVPVQVEDSVGQYQQKELTLFQLKNKRSAFCFG